MFCNSNVQLLVQFVFSLAVLLPTLSFCSHPLLHWHSHRAQNTAMNVVTTMLKRYWGWGHW